MLIEFNRESRTFNRGADLPPRRLQRKQVLLGCGVHGVESSSLYRRQRTEPYTGPRPVTARPCNRVGPSYHLELLMFKLIK